MVICSLFCKNNLLKEETPFNSRMSSLMFKIFIRFFTPLAQKVEMAMHFVYAQVRHCILISQIVIEFNIMNGY